MVTLQDLPGECVLLQVAQVTLQDLPLLQQGSSTLDLGLVAAGAIHVAGLMPGTSESKCQRNQMYVVG